MHGTLSVSHTETVIDLRQGRRYDAALTSLKEDTITAPERMTPTHESMLKTLNPPDDGLVVFTAPELGWLVDRGVPYPYKALSPYKQVKHLTAAGFSAEEICQLVDLPSQEVFDLNATIPRHLTDIVLLHAVGFTPVEIAEELDIPRPTVYYHLHDLGIKPRRRRAPEITITQQAQVEKLRAQGVPYVDIADRVHITYEQVRAAIRRSSNGSKP